jgi:hypothetical protein
VRRRREHAFSPGSTTSLDHVLVRAGDEFEAALRELRALAEQTDDDPEAAARRRAEIDRLNRRLDELAETVELA